MSLATSNPEGLYELLVSLLIKCPQTIEILPGDGSIWMYPQNPEDAVSQPSFSPFLYVEDNLGIPQTILYKVYLHAVGVFKAARGRIPTELTMSQRNHNLDASLIYVLVASSSILILGNPSHQTALNTRKHLVRMRVIDPNVELRFMASLLSSQHCAKHAELWYHRRWLLCASYDLHLSDIATMDPSCPLRFTSRDAIQQELWLVSRACELYPRNYFAWTHRLIYIQSLLSAYLTGMDTMGFVSIFRQEIAGAKGWIDRHVSDYSAVHFVLTLSKAAFQSGNPSLVEIIIEGNLLDHALSLVREYPAHEALWMYIQMALSISDLWHPDEIQQFVDDFVKPLVFSQHPKIGVKEDLANASDYARHFLKRKQALNSLNNSASNVVGFLD